MFPIKRFLLIGLGTSFVCMGFIGAFVPLIPATPFLLLAAACYARSSDRLYHRLLSHRAFGPLIREWREHRAMPMRAKRTAILLIVVCFSISARLNLNRAWVWMPLVIFGMGLIAFIWRIPSRDQARSS